MKPATIRDLGPQARGDYWYRFTLGRDPASGRSILLGLTSAGQAAALDPIRRSVRWSPPPHAGTAAQLAPSPTGLVYVVRGSTVRQWDLVSGEMREAPPPPGAPLPAFDPEGRMLYRDAEGFGLWDFQEQRTAQHWSVAPLEGYDLATTFSATALDEAGWLYATVVARTAERNAPRRIAALELATGQWRLLRGQAPGGELIDLTLARNNRPDWRQNSMGDPGLHRDRHGAILAGVMLDQHRLWFRCQGGQATPVSPLHTGLAETIAICGNWREAHVTPRMEDGNHLAEISGEAFTIEQADGGRRRVAFQHDGDPLGIWCVGADERGRIWGGCVFPARTFRYDPRTGETVVQDNTTAHGGEVYNIQCAGGKAYTCSYRFAKLAVIDPEEHDRFNMALNAGPGLLGYMKEHGLTLERCHGGAVLPDGRVAFAAQGDYGCHDSGVSVIDPETWHVGRFVYPDRRFEALTWLPEQQLLLLSEAREGEAATRASLVCPDTGEIRQSHLLFDEPGGVTSWLVDDRQPHIVYGMFAYRGRLFALDARTGRILHQCDEITQQGIPGGISYNMLVFSPGGEILGLTSECVFTIDRELKQPAVLARYHNPAGYHGAYHFGMAYGNDGALYFPAGPNLMRLSWQDP